MMLRTTISRIKRVCAVACIPRLLRGDLRCAPCKFEIFSYDPVKKAQKSTKSTDDDEFDHKKEKHKDANEHCFSSQTESDKPKCDVEIPGEEVFKENVAQIIAPKTSLKETHCVRCQTIIDQAFGKNDNDRILSEQYYSHSVANMQETKREIDEKLAKLELKDINNLDKPTREIIKFGIIKSKEERDLDENTSIRNENMLKATAINKNVEKTAENLNHALNIHMTSAKESENVTEKVENVNETKAPMLDEGISNKTENVIEPATATFNKQEYKINVFRDQPSAQDPLSRKATFLKESIDNAEYDKDSSTKASRFHLRERTDTVADIHEENLDLKDNRVGSVYTSTADIPILKDPVPTNVPLTSTACKEYIDHNVQQAEIEENLNVQNVEEVNILHATTAHENEEKITQKIEHIDEAPLVEPPKSNVEGFNVEPKVLEDAHTCNYYCETKVVNHQSTRMNMPTNFDEVAKRCLDTPTNQIDEILLKEMENLGIPITSNRAPTYPTPSPVIEDDLVQMDVLGKPRRPVEKNDLDLESHECERGAVDLCSAKKEYLARHLSREKMLPLSALKSADLNSGNASSVDPTHTLSEAPDVPKIHPNQVLIDPYDKKTLAYDTEVYNSNETFNPSKKYSYFYVPDAKATEAESKYTPTLASPESAMTKQEVTGSERILNAKQAEYHMLEKQDTELESYWPLEEKAPISSKHHKMTKSQSQTTESGIDEPLLGYEETLKPSHIIYAEAIEKPSATAAREQHSRTDSTASTMNNSTTTNEQRTKISASDCLWNQDQFDPKYVLTCNETCPISPAVPESLFGPNQNPNTRTVFDHNFQAADSLTRNIYSRSKLDNLHMVVSKASWNRFSDSIPTPNTSQKTSKNTKNTHNITNMSVPDDIWDTEQLETELSAMQAQKNYEHAIEASDFDSPRVLQNATPTNIKIRHPFVYERENGERENLLEKPVVIYNEPGRKIPRPSFNLGRPVGAQGTLECYFSKVESASKVSSCTQMSAQDKTGLNPLVEEQNEAMDSPGKGFSLYHHPIGAQGEQTQCLKPPGIPVPFHPLPDLHEDVSLSELLKRVRERSRIIECVNELKALGIDVEPIMTAGRCRRKAPRCPPTAPRSPPTNPIPPPPLGLPAIKPRPPACRPRRGPKAKCTSCNLDVTANMRLGPKMKARKYACHGMACDTEPEEGPIAIADTDIRSRADLTDEVIDRLQTIGTILSTVLRQETEVILEAGALMRNWGAPKVVLAKDYVPWSPIPSWPLDSSKPPEFRKKVNPCNPCPIPGCKIPPPRLTHDPPCNQKPCGFPKKTFSLLDCFAVSLGDHKVYDLGDF